MGLVDYSDSDASDNEAQASKPSAPAPKPAAPPGAKPTFQKVVDGSNRNKIRVNLPAAAASSVENDDGSTGERPAKKARIGGGGKFSGLSSFLPAPKRSGGAHDAATEKKPGVGRGLGSGISLRTGAEPAFNRAPAPSTIKGEDVTDAITANSNAPAPKEAEVKLVGNNTVFKPLSVSRKNQKKRRPIVAAQTAVIGEKTAESKVNLVPPVPPKPRMSLFGISQSTPDLTPSISLEADNGTADAALRDEENDTEQYHHEAEPSFEQTQPSVQAGTSNTLGDIASSMNLDAATRRQLFGRNGKASNMPINIVNFDTDREYAANEELRAQGETVQHNPVRAIQPGKHTLKQLVNAAVSQKDALEESWAAGQRNKRETGNRYGW